MGRVYIEDVTSIALLYHYKATGSISTMLSRSIIEEYAKIINQNLDDMQSDFKGNCLSAEEYSIYFNTQDENKKWYSVLRSDIDLAKAQSDLIKRLMGYDVIRASQKPNALEVLDIKLIDGRMQKIERDKQKVYR